jgi:hypothetical protein
LGKYIGVCGEAFEHFTIVRVGYCDLEFIKVV